MITSLIAEPYDSFSFRVSYTSDETPPITFTVYVDGVQVDQFVSDSVNGSTIVNVSAGALFIEVTDIEGQRPHPAYPGRFTLNFRRISGAASYLVQQYVDATWTTQEIVPEIGEGNYVYLSEELEDSVQHEFRVVPVDESGTQGTPVEFTATMVRHPSPPNVTYTWDSEDEKLTVALA